MKENKDCCCCCWYLTWYFCFATVLGWYKQRWNCFLFRVLRKVSPERRNARWPEIAWWFAQVGLMLQPRTKPVETHYKNTYFLHLPWQKCLLSHIKSLFPPSPIAMLFAVTQEMHALAAEPKQHCTRVGEGAYLFLLDTMVTSREIENCTEMSQQFCPGL